MGPGRSRRAGGEDDHRGSVAEERVQQLLRPAESLVHLAHADPYAPAQQDRVEQGDEDGGWGDRGKVHGVDVRVWLTFGCTNARRLGIFLYTQCSCCLYFDCRLQRFIFSSRRLHTGTRSTVVLKIIPFCPLDLLPYIQPHALHHKLFDKQ